MNVSFQSSSADVSPSITPCGTPLSGTHAPKYGTVIPNRIFVGGIAANTTEAELKQFFQAYGAVKDSKIIADRAGVSKGYGFITFENQEDAERIIKKEADNLVFKDRKLNIGPAIRKQQVLQRSFDGIADHEHEILNQSIPTGTVMFSNGVPYTYQNGMAIFHSPEGGYQIPQPQVSPQQPAYSTVMVPQTPTMYVSPQYSAYQPTTPQWTTAANPWRWAPQQSPGQTIGGNPSYIYAAMHASPELMYAQPPPHQAYQTGEMTDTMLEGPPLEGSGMMQDPSLVNNPYVTDYSEQPLQPTLAMTTIPVHPQAPTVAPPPCKSTTTAAASVAPYTKKSLSTIPRRPYSSPTYLVKHGNKVQRLMIPSKAMAAHMALLRSPESAGLELAEGLLRHPLLTPPPDK
ncbi:protein boule-like isoform X3 [Mizuhopecten yessoensis]|uniref:protein boule-like isoform X3 n=1 Tax=Mizuhopecten yessoensis TaxID=6573 RepID=UPI000B45DB54|nr:protein boule-like isoform X3 [Mizuhopecten yessoensis]